MTRLNLNWEITLRSDRVNFARDYLNAIPFTPTEDELETISNYILWGKNSTNEKDGPARLKDEGVFLDSKWNGSSIELESLDELKESPTFSENDLRPLDAPAPKRTREIFSRKEARELASPLVLETLEAIWDQIDTIELLLNYYELDHGRRKNPPRQQLLLRFEPEKIEALRARASTLSQFNYFKLKHQLVELRQQQYTYQDSYKHTIIPLKMRPYQEMGTPSEFGADISILPLGVVRVEGKHAKTFGKIFRGDRFPEPEDFSPEELNFISRFLWKPVESKKVFDFGNEEHLYEMFGIWRDLEDQAVESESTRLFLETAKIYIQLAHLDPKEELILELKIRGKSNQEIQDAVLHKYGHKYQLNYISTLYCKKILGKIGEAAKFHREVCENLSFLENFKKCKDCGRSLLLNERNWMKRKRSNDGFSPRCKCCEKIKRIG